MVFVDGHLVCGAVDEFFGIRDTGGEVVVTGGRAFTGTLAKKREPSRHDHRTLENGPEDPTRRGNHFLVMAARRG